MLVMLVLTLKLICRFLCENKITAWQYRETELSEKAVHLCSAGLFQIFFYQY